MNWFLRELRELREQNKSLAEQLNRSQAQRDSAVNELQKMARHEEKWETHYSLLQAAYKGILEHDRLRNAFRGAENLDLFRGIMQIASGHRETAIVDGTGPKATADERAYAAGKIEALDALKRDLLARVAAANRD